MYRHREDVERGSVMGKAKDGNKRLMITLPKKLVSRLENDTRERGLGLTKSARIQLALENDLKKDKDGNKK